MKGREGERRHRRKKKGRMKRGVKSGKNMEVRNEA